VGSGRKEAVRRVCQVDNSLGEEKEDKAKRPEYRKQKAESKISPVSF
jgi:hypothetical protein